MRKLVKTTRPWSHIAKATRIGEVRKLKFSFVKPIVCTFENNQYIFHLLVDHHLAWGSRAIEMVHPSTKKGPVRGY